MLTRLGLHFASAAVLLAVGPHAAAGQVDTAHRDAAPYLGENVYIFNPHMPQKRIQAALDRIGRRQVDNQFGPERYALLFAPGTYGSAEHPLDFQVGYYTAVAGLGAAPTEVVINGTAQVRNRCFNGACVALDNFWRSLSNLTINVTSRKTGCEAGEIWAVSQAAPIRRLRVTGGDFRLTDTCSKPSHASGGFIADSQFSGAVINGTQQQFMVRNSALESWSNGNWNQVFSGVVGAPATCASADPKCAYTTLAASPTSREAPYLYVNGRNEYRVFVPSVQHGTVGTTWSAHTAPGVSIPVAKFYIARPGDDAAHINAALAAGKHLIFTPGIYRLDRSIEIARADTVVLGLGFPTLIPQHGSIAMQVSASKGVALSGILFEAGATSSPALLKLGEERHTGGDAADPSALHDVFFRIGGAQTGKAAVSLAVNADHVILDHIWAWRADHGEGIGWNKNTAATGALINGNDVTAYGLFVEHYQQTEVVWNGDDGTVIFFQNEMPYDPPSQAAWSASAAQEGFAAFTVGAAVQRFRGYGMGSYCYFNQGLPIYAANAFEVPSSLAPGSLNNVFTIFLNAKTSGGIRNVINDQGGAATNGIPDIAVRVPSYP